MVDYIKHLLKFHDCVIIPGLGGLISHYEPAKRSLSTSTISPPSKKIAFNPSLRQNDGLLINHIMIKEGLTYKQSEEAVTEFKVEVEKSLQATGSYLFMAIGRLSYDEQKSLQFFPIIKENLLINSFGLSRVVAQPIHRLKEAYEESNATEFTKVIELTPVEIEEEQHDDIEIPIYKPWYFRTAAAVGLIFLMMTAGINLYQGDISSEQFSFLPKINTTTELSEGLQLNNALYELNEPSKEDFNLYNNVIVEKTNIISNSSVTSNNKFYIIIGSFLNETRMNKEIANMQSKNFNVTTLQGPKGYTRVALVFSENNVVKSTQLKEVRKNVNSEAWMLNN